MKKYFIQDKKIKHDKLLIQSFKNVDEAINITGGGSLIHCNQTKFTNFLNNNKYFLFGTGMTDNNSCNLNENVIQNFIKNPYEFAFKNANIQKNMKNIKYFQDKNKLYGGFRGIFEKIISEYNGLEFKYINDPGIL